MEMKPLSSYRAFLFDMDGTLLDSMWIWKKIDIDYLASFGLSVPEDLQSEIGGLNPMQTALYMKERFHIESSPEQMIKEWNDMAYRAYRDDIHLKKGVSALLAWARDKGIKIALATSSPKLLAEAALHANDVRAYFDVIITGDQVKAGKPDPEIYLTAAAQLQVSPEHCLVFEDILSGIKAGKAAGMTVVAVEDAYGFDDRDAIGDAADLFIRDFEQLLRC